MAGRRGRCRARRRGAARDSDLALGRHDLAVEIAEVASREALERAAQLRRVGGGGGGREAAGPAQQRVDTRESLRPGSWRSRAQEGGGTLAVAERQPSPKYASPPLGCAGSRVASRVSRPRGRRPTAAAAAARRSRSGCAQRICGSYAAPRVSLPPEESVSSPRRAVAASPPCAGPGRGRAGGPCGSSSAAQTRPPPRTARGTADRRRGSRGVRSGRGRTCPSPRRCVPSRGPARRARTRRRRA